MVRTQLELTFTEGLVVDKLKKADRAGKARWMAVLRQELSTDQLLEIYDAAKAELIARGAPVGSI